MYRSFVFARPGLKSALALSLLGLFGASLRAHSLTVPAEPMAEVVQGIELGWGTFGGSAAAGFINFTPSDKKKSFQVGYVSAAPVFFNRREMIYFRLPPIPANRKEIAQAVIRLVSNGCQDKSAQLVGRELRVFHQALGASPLNSYLSYSAEAADAGTQVAAIPVSELPRMNIELLVDVTEPLRAQLSSRAGTVAVFRFQISDDFGIKLGESAFFQFRGFHDNLPADRPSLGITYR
jgi:hypothetical protein